MTAIRIPIRTAELGHERARCLPVGPSAALVWTREGVLDLLRLENFRDWLRSLNPDRIVGEASEACECPLAFYLMRQGVFFPLIGGSVVDWFNPGAINEERRLTVAGPAWMKTFTSRIDGLGATLPGRLVTAANCLAVLEHLDDDWQVAA
jgi:hypothetical protein